jgi:NitT/TauT family transport system substrate-binding protein
VADGTYKKYGLDVTIQQGGPQVNNRPLLPAGKIDFLMTGNLLHTFRQRQERRAHHRGGRHVPEGPAGADRPPRPGLRQVRGDLKNAPTADQQGRPVQLVAVAEGRARLQGRAAQALQLQPGPFLADKKSVQQGYSISRADLRREPGRL